MPFGPPDFPLNVNLWRRATLFANPPDKQFMGNLSCRKNGSVQFSGAVAGMFEILSIELLCPAREDIRGRNGPANMDLVEVPAGSGRCYVVACVEDVGRSYLNEYRLARIFQLTTECALLTGNPWAAPLWPAPAP